MEKSKAAIVGILGIVATLMIISVFIPEQVLVERRVKVYAPPSLIYHQISTAVNWKNWSYWIRSGSTSIIPSGGNSFYWKGNGRNTGEGRLTISKSTPFELIEAGIERKDHEPVKSVHRLDETPDGVIVYWSLQTHVGKSPYRKFLGLFMKKYVGEKMEESLGNLKKIIEPDRPM